MEDILKKYGWNLSSEEINAAAAGYEKRVDEYINDNVLSRALGFIDLTTLHTQDTQSHVRAFVEKVNGFKASFPSYPLPASICVYPNFGSTVKRTLSAEASESVHVTCVAGCFPTSQSWSDVKALEALHAVEQGADEIDIVLAVGEFLEGNLERVYNEISLIRRSIDSTPKGKVLLKVILETGALASVENIARASFVAMEAGADFIKTSTGKMEPSATPQAAVTMCNCIRLFHSFSGKRVGFKPAGGISTSKGAALYSLIVKDILGDEWLTPSLFRIGASSLANNLLTDLERRSVKYF